MKGIRVETAKTRRMSLAFATAILLVIVAMTLALSGCGSSGNSSGDSSGADATAEPVAIKIGGTSLFEEPDLDPSAYNWTLTKAGICETLMKLDAGGEPQPWLAESMENIDPHTWVITIKDGITFSNGEPLTAESVKACFERTFEKNTRAAENLVLESIEADGQKLTIVSKDAVPSLPNTLANPMFVIYYVGEGVDYGSGPIGTGPFIVSDLKPDKEFTIVKNEDYREGAPALDEVRFIKYDDADALMLALQNGEVDVLDTPTAAGLELFKDDSNFAVVSVPSTRVDFLRFNMENSAVMKNPAVRTAIAYAIDRPGYCDTITAGMESPNWGVYSDAVAYGGIDGFNVTVTESSTEKAAQVLEEAGIVDSDGDGIRELDGKPLEVTITTCSDYQQFVDLCDSLQSSLKDCGVKLNIQILDYWLLDKETWMNSGTDISIDSYAMAPTGDPQYFTSMCFVSGASDNFGGYNNPKMDELFTELTQTFDEDKRTEIARQMSQVELDDCAFVFFAAADVTYITSAKVQNLEPASCEFYLLTTKSTVVE